MAARTLSARRIDRARVSDAIEALLALLDAIDGDAEMEPTTGWNEFRAGYVGCPSESAAGIYANRHDEEAEDTDPPEDCGDDEPDQPREADGEFGMRHSVGI